MKGRFVSIRTKMIALFCSLITVPFIFSGMLAYERYSSHMEAESGNYARQIANQLAINLDRYIRDLDRITLGLFFDNSVLDILRDHSAPGTALTYMTTDERIRMNQYMSSLVIDQTEIEGIFIFANDGILFSNLNESVRVRWSEENEAWMKQASERKGALAVIPPASMNYYLQEPGVVLSITRQIIDPVSGQDIGYIKVDIASRGMNQLFAGVSLSNHGAIYIRNSAGEVLYPFDRSGMRLNEAGPPADPDSNLIASSRAEYAGLEVIGVIPKGEVTRGAREVVRFTAAISLLSLVIAYLSAIFVSGRLVRPIRYLQMKMRVVESGNLKEKANVYTRDEIGQLTESFNGMVQKLDRTVREVYEIRIKENEAQLAALQSQMNPHFLYNTLESIRMEAAKERHEQLSAIISSLGNLLRYTIDKHEGRVPLGEELAFLAHYLEVQAFRLEDRLRTDIRVDLSHEHIQVPKLILQPLVENAIEHGLGERPLRIVVTSRMEEDTLVLKVEDDGIGMSDEMLARLQSGLAFSDAGHRAKRGYALRNIHQRLQLLYGSAAGISFERGRPSGVSVEIRLPIPSEEEATE